MNIENEDPQVQRPRETFDQLKKPMESVQQDVVPNIIAPNMPDPTPVSTEQAERPLETVLTPTQTEQTVEPPQVQSTIQELAPEIPVVLNETLLQTREILRDITNPEPITEAVVNPVTEPIIINQSDVPVEAIERSAVEPLTETAPNQSEVQKLETPLEQVDVTNIMHVSEGSVLTPNMKAPLTTVSVEERSELQPQFDEVIRITQTTELERVLEAAPQPTEAQPSTLVEEEAPFPDTAGNGLTHEAINEMPIEAPAPEDPVVAEEISSIQRPPQPEITESQLEALVIQPGEGIPQREEMKEEQQMPPPPSSVGSKKPPVATQSSFMNDCKKHVSRVQRDKETFTKAHPEAKKISTISGGLKQIASTHGSGPVSKVSSLLEKRKPSTVEVPSFDSLMAGAKRNLSRVERDQLEAKKRAEAEKEKHLIQKQGETRAVVLKFDEIPDKTLKANPNKLNQTNPRAADTASKTLCGLCSKNLYDPASKVNTRMLRCGHRFHTDCLVTSKNECNKCASKPVAAKPAVSSVPTRPGIKAPAKPIISSKPIGK